MLDFLVMTASQLKEAANTTRFYKNHLKPAERPIVRQILDELKCMAVVGDDHLDFEPILLRVRMLQERRFEAH